MDQQFRDNYVSARERILNAAHGAGAQLETFLLAAHCVPGGRGACDRRGSAWRPPVRARAACHVWDARVRRARRLRRPVLVAGACRDRNFIDRSHPARANAYDAHVRDLVRNWKRSELETLIEQDPKLRDMPLLKTGRMKQALQRWLPRTRINGAVVECGTERAIVGMTVPSPHPR